VESEREPFLDEMRFRCFVNHIIRPVDGSMAHMAEMDHPLIY